MGFFKNLANNMPVASTLDYVTGCPEWNTNKFILIEVSTHKKYIKITDSMKTNIICNLDDIEVTLESETQFRERVTVTRLLLVGIFALAFKKKSNVNNLYITLKFKELDFEDVRRKYKDVEIVFTNKEPSKVERIYNEIMRYKAQY